MAFLAAAAPAISAVSTGLSIFGAIQGFMGQRQAGKAAEASANYNAAVAANNAVIARRNADMAGQEGAAAVESAQMEQRAKIAALKTNQAASGVDINSGSAVDVRSSAAATGQLSALDIRSRAARKAYGYKTQADDYMAQSGLYKAQGKFDRQAADMDATTTLLGGLSQAGQGWATYQQKTSPMGI